MGLGVGLGLASVLGSVSNQALNLTELFSVFAKSCEILQLGADF